MAWDQMKLPYDQSGSIMAPGKRGFNITPSDSDDLPFNTRQIYVGGTGSIKVEFEDDPVGTFTTFSAVPAGSEHPWALRKIYATGTTATLLVGIY